MANVSEALYNWSNTGGSNQPDSGDSPTVQADLQAIQAGVRGWLAYKGADIASVAGTTDVGAVEGLAHDITGTEAITGLGTVSAGIWKILKFEGAATLTHNATSLILPGGANITTANGDIGIFISEGSGNWRCVSYARAAAQPVQAASDTVAGVIEYAIQSEMEAGSSATLAVTPGRQHFHPGSAKGWVKANIDGTIDGSYNVTSVTDNSTGNISVNWATDFADTNYCVLSALKLDFGGAAASTWVTSIMDSNFAAGVTRSGLARVSDGQADVDPTEWMFVAFGDFA